MGNHNQHQQIYQYINSLKVLHKYSQYSILEDHNHIQYVKFIYAPISDSNHSPSYYHKTNSIFNHKYLQYRYHSLKQTNPTSYIPRIIAFGQQPQPSTIISCSSNKLNFVLFQHPTKTLKQQIQNRITTGQPFKQQQLLKLIKSVIQALTQYYQHIKNWNQQILQKRPFTINQDNIYINHKGDFVISDIISNFNDIQNITKQQVTLKRSSRANSLTNLHAKTNGRKLKNKFYQTNLNHLALIIQGIIFKFQCFSQPHKTISQQSQSLSTALQSHRGNYKSFIGYSFEFQKILKELRNDFSDYNKIGDQVDRLINLIHLPLPLQRSQQTSMVLLKNNSIQKISFYQNSFINKKLNTKQTQRKPLAQIKELNKAGDNQIKFQRSSQYILSKRNSNFSLQNNHLVNKKSLQKCNTKIRLSLSKGCDHKEQTQQKTLSINKDKNLNMKNCNPKFLCSKTQNRIKDKQNIPIFTQSIPKQKRQNNYKKIQNSLQKVQQKTKKQKELSQNNNNKLGQGAKKKILLKKQKSENNQNQNPKQLKNENKQQTIHMNPMSRKKTFGLNKHMVCKSKQKVSILKTIQKANNQFDVEFIQNLSSIMSNQNNTLSSYGIPMTDEFKTQNSLIQEEGCIGFNLNDEPSPIKSVNLKQGLSESNQFSKKSGPNYSPPCVKLSSYPSLQLVQSIIQRGQQKIPQFYKQYKLPQKNLLALNKIILKQKNVIIEQSFEQSQLNSIRHSIPNIMNIEQQIRQIKKRNSKIGFELGQVNRISRQSQLQQLDQMNNQKQFDQIFKLQQIEKPVNN